MSDKLTKTQIENPRYDLFTGEILPFKSKDFYINNFYANKTNLAKHFKTLEKSEIVSITSDILKKRIENKGIKYVPSLVEIKSIIAPSIIGLEKSGVDYTKLCESLGLLAKYKYNVNSINFVTKSLTQVITDTREQNPLQLPIKTLVRTLKYGDYAVSATLENSLVIERKSLSDFVGTMSKGYERFQRELSKAFLQDSNILMVIENDFSSSLSFDYLPHMRFCKATPEYIFSNLRKLLQSFPNFQASFVKNRTEAAELTVLALSIGKQLFNYDVQYLLEKKLILND